MIELSYCSKAVASLAIETVFDLNRKAQRKNDLEGISGVLTYDQKLNEFFQVLEGRRESVMHLMKSILADTRHSGVIVNSLSDIKKRTYGDWSMCLVTNEDLKSTINHVEEVDDWLVQRFLIIPSLANTVSRNLLAKSLKGIYLSA